MGLYFLEEKGTPAFVLVYSQNENKPAVDHIHCRLIESVYLLPLNRIFLVLSR